MPRRSVLALLAALAVLAPAAVAQEAPVSDEKALAVLRRAADRYASLDGFCARFEQERVVPLLSQTTVSRGELCQMPPGYFRMDFSEPQEDLVVADGEHVWMYYPSVNPGQVIRAGIGSGGGRTLDFHREFLAEPARRFRAAHRGREKVTGRATEVLELRPREAGAGYVRARVWVEEERGLIRKVEIEEENEAIRRVVLSGIRTSPGLGPADFAFEPPPGVQVIRR